MSHAERCLVCGGNGLVPSGFYATTTGYISGTTVEFEQCRSCQGRGFVVIEEEPEPRWFVPQTTGGQE